MCGRNPPTQKKQTPPRSQKFGITRIFAFLCFALITLISATPLRAAFDLQRLPDAQALETIRQSGWAAAADALEAQLAESWRPSHAGQTGSSANETFRRWLLLQRWCRLLGTPEPEALQAYLGRRVFEDPSHSGALSVVPPGMKLPADRSGRPLPTAADKLAHARIPAEILQALLPSDYTPQEGETALRAKQDFLLQLAGDYEFLREFFRMLTPDDFPPTALMRLEELHSAHPGFWQNYQSLALAFALVYDQRRPAFWPHPQVEPGTVPEMDEPLSERFARYARLNEARRLDYDLRSLSAAELKFVVDAPVSKSELEWAVKNMRVSRNRFEDAFITVGYDLKRAENGVFKWPHGRYLLSDIREHGGICVDQAYFAALSGKARGIPTLFFAGQGMDGGHAWFGYLRGNGRWELDAGRYVNQNYTVGEALDPQTWLPITDHELLHLSGRLNRDAGYDAALADLAMVEIFSRRGNQDARLAAAESALFNSPALTATWEEMEQALEKNGREAELKAFYTRAIDHFRRDEDLRVRYQTRLAEWERTAGDQRIAAKIESRMIRENRRERTDLSVSAGADALSRRIKSGDYEGALREFRTLATKLGRTGGGNFFYDVIRPFVRQLRQAGRDKDAAKALQTARRTMPIEPNSVLDRDFSELENEGANR